MGGGDMQQGNHPAGHDHRDQLHHHPFDHPLMGNEHQRFGGHEHHAHFLGGRGGRGHPPPHHFGGRGHGCGRRGGRGHMHPHHHNNQFGGPWGCSPSMAPHDLVGPSNYGPIHARLTPFMMMRGDHGHNHHHLHHGLGGPFRRHPHPYDGHHHLHHGRRFGRGNCHGCSSTAAGPCDEANDQVCAEGREANANIGSSPIVVAN